MAVNNQIIVKQFPAGSVIVEMMSEVWDFFEEAFTGFEGVTIERNDVRKIMYIYLDDDKKMSVQIKINDTNDAVQVEYWLGDEKCTYYDSIYPTHNMAYLRTVYGIAWGRDSYTISSTDFSKLRNVFTLKSTPTVFINAADSSIGYVISPLHNTIETMVGSEYLADSQGNQRFVVCNAFSCDHNLRLRHLFRVLHKDNQTRGRILVENKRLFYLHKYALEYEEE